MKIALASDHRGYDAKRKLLPVLKQWGHDILDFGCPSSSPASDYPDFAFPAARAIVDGKCDAGLFFDGSGIGMSIAANKVPGVRAAAVHDEVTARMAREANHCNVLCLACDLLSDAHMRKIIHAFLTTPFGEGRHARRVAKIRDFEHKLARQHG
jgi:ribose 5-phosphate isomerase B